MDPGLKMLLAGLLVIAVGGALWFQARSRPQERPASEARRAPEPVATPSAAVPSSEEMVEWVEIDSAEAGGGSLPDTSGAYEISAVEVRPELTNRAELSRLLSRNYPPLLQDAGVGGMVALRFRIRPDGTVDRESIQVLQSTHDEFSAAAFRVVQAMRFTPGLIKGQPVAVWAELPVQFLVER